MARSATHKGTCQVCGHLQRLPKSRLSKHGYTVSWGFFSGTCPGAHELPLQQDRSILDRIMVDLEAQATTLEDPSTEPATIVCDVAVRLRSLSSTDAHTGRVANSLTAFRELALEHESRWQMCSWALYEYDGDGELVRDNDGHLVINRAATIAKQYPLAVKAAKVQMLLKARGCRAHVARMRALAETVYGQPLVAIGNEDE